jgi:molybdate transport system permease protein
MTAAEWRIVRFTAGIGCVEHGVDFAVWRGAGVASCAAPPALGKTLVEMCAAFPLVLPPAVTGLVLLELCGRRGPAGHFFHSEFPIDIVFIWRAIALALAVISFPRLVWTARPAIELIKVPRIHLIPLPFGNRADPKSKIQRP